MAALAFAPSVSHALAAGAAPGPWSEICTTLGLNTSVPAGGEESGAALHLEHCPLCAQAAHAPGLPPAEISPLIAAPGGDALPPLFLHAPHPLFAWTRAQPRAPPLSS